MSSPTPEPSGTEGPDVDDLQRLSSYLDGELDADEHAALEAELAGALDLRAQLERLARVDRCLADELPPATLPEGARQRLDVALDATLEQTLGAGPTAPHAGTPVAPTTADTPVAPTTAEASGRRSDELAGRRRPRRRVAVTAGAGIAAGLALVAGGIVSSTQFDRGPGDTVDEVATLQADQFDAREGAEAEADSAPAADEASLAGALPVVIDEGRVGGDGNIEALLDDPELRQLARRDLGTEQGALLAALVQDQVLGGDGMGSQAPAPLVTREGVELEEAVSASLRRCLTALLDQGEQAVPVAIELLTLEEGDQAAMFGLLTLDPSTGAFDRIEAWTLDLDACEVLRFDQS